MHKIKSFFVLLVMLMGALMATPVQAEIVDVAIDYELVAELSASEELITVEDFKVIDGDTADFILDRVEEPSIKARFLLIDTPEKIGNVAYSQEASDRVQALLNSAELIQIEYEGAKKDAYQRDLVHVWVDGVLLQEILVAEGLAIARYIEDYIPNSKYAEVIFEAQAYAKEHELNVWLDGDETYLAKAEYAPGTVIEESDNPNIDYSDDDVGMVYIAPYSGNKYHFDPNCRGLRNAREIGEIPLEDAVRDGYTLCGYED